MNKDQVKGRVKEVAGTIKEVAGKATGKAGLQAKGTIEKTVGKMQAGYGDAKADAESRKRK